MSGRATTVDGGDSGVTAPGDDRRAHTTNRKARRRHAIARLLAAGIGAGALARLGTRTAQAIDGDAVLAGQTVNASSPTRIRNNILPNDYTPDSTADGVQGYATGANNSGLFGRNNVTGGIGVAGAAPSGTGVFGESVNGYGVGAKSTSGYAVWGTAPVATGWAGVFSGKVWTSADMIVSANLAVYGDLTVYGPNKSAAVLHPDGSYRRLYCVEAPESYFEDIGRGQLTSGRGQVQLDPDFAAVIRTDSYDVFLTPRGDCRGLYVASQTAAGFEVRELQGGTSTLGFSYRIMAHRKDNTAPRLERVPPPSLAPPAGGPGVPTPTGATATVAPATATPTLPASSATPQPTSTQTATPTPTTLPTRTPTPGPAGSPAAT